MERELQNSLKRGLDNDEIELGTLERKLFNLSQQAYQTSTSYLSSFSDKFRRRYNMYNSIHHTGEKYLDKKYGKSKHYVPKTHEFVKNQLSQVIQAYFQNPEFLSLDPINPADPIAAMSAEYFTAVINYKLGLGNNWMLKFINISYTSQLMHNTSIAKVDWNADMKRPTAIPILIERFRLDPHSDPLDPIGSSPYLIYIQEMYVADIKKKIERTDKYKWLDIDEDRLVKATASSFEDDVNVSRYKDGVDHAQSTTGISNELTKVFVHENIVNIDDQDYVFYTLGTLQMLSPVFKLEEIYPQGRPFVMGSIFPEENKIYSASLLDHAYEPQTQINNFTNIVFDSAKKAVEPVVVIKANSGIDAHAYMNAGAGTAILARNPQTDIHQVTSQVNAQSLRSEIPFLMFNYDSVLGGVSSSSTAMGTSPETATGQNMAIQVQNQVTEMYLRNFHESFIIPVLRLIIKVEKVYGRDNKTINRIFSKTQLLERYSDRLKLAGYDIKEDGFTIEKPFIDAEVDINVNIGMGATSPQQRFERLMASVAQMRQLVPNIDQLLDVQEWLTEIMVIQGYKNPQKFFKTGVNPKVQELTQELEQAKQEIAQAKKKTPEEVAVDIKHREAEIQKIQAEIDQIKSATTLNESKSTKELVQAQYGAIEAGEVLVSIPEVAQAGDQVLHNAGYKHPEDTVLGGADAGFFNQLQLPEQAPMNQQENIKFAGVTPQLQIPNEGEATPLTKTNNNPLYPAKPDSAFKGFNAGINTGKQ